METFLHYLQLAGFLLFIGCLYFFNSILKYGFRVGLGVLCVKEAKKFAKNQKKISEDDIPDGRLKNFKLNKTNTRKIVSEGFIDPIVAATSDYDYQFPLALENYMLWEFHDYEHKDIFLKLERLLRDEDQMRCAKEYIVDLIK